jgi:uncharacterized delta-60 repeat protein
MAAARLNTDGTLDTTGFGTNGRTTVAFNLGGGLADAAQAVGIQSTGKIVLAGFAQTGANSFDFAAARLNTDGTLDTAGFGMNGLTTIAFNLGGNKDDEALALAIQADDGIVLAGRAAQSTTVSDVAVARLTADGVNNGIMSAYATTSAAVAITLQPSTGKIVLAGDVGGGLPLVMRLNADLSPDSTFNGTGTFAVNFGSNGYVAAHADAVLLQADGKLIVAGTAQQVSPSETGGFVARLIEVAPTIPPTIPPMLPPVLQPLAAFLTGVSVKLNPLRPAASKLHLTFHGTLRVQPGAFELRWGNLKIPLKVVVSATADGTAVDLSLKLPRGKLPHGRTVTLITHGNRITLPDGTLFDAAGNGVPGSTRTDVFKVPVKRFNRR